MKKDKFVPVGFLPFDASTAGYRCTACNNISYRTIGTEPEYCMYCDRENERIKHNEKL